MKNTLLERAREARGELSRTATHKHDGRKAHTLDLLDSLIADLERGEVRYGHARTPQAERTAFLVEKDLTGSGQFTVPLLVIPLEEPILVTDAHIGQAEAILHAAWAAQERYSPATQKEVEAAARVLAESEKGGPDGG